MALRAHYESRFMLDFRIYFYVQTLIFQKNLFVPAWNGVREEK